jgi:hypothetical protein
LQAKEELDKDIVIKNAEAARGGASAANMALASAMHGQQGSNKGNGKYVVQMGGADGGGAARDEIDAVNILEEYMGDYASDKHYGLKDGITLTIDDYTNPVEVVDFYEKLVQARDQMLKTMSPE